MIQKVSSFNFINQYQKALNISNSEPITKPDEISQTNITKLKGIPFSYISFKGADNNNNIKMNIEAKKLLQKAEEIALNNKHSEITPQHIIEAAIVDLEDYLNNDGVNEEEKEPALISLAETLAKKELLYTENETNFFVEQINALAEANSTSLATIEKSDVENKNLQLSNDFKEDLKNIDVEINEYNLLGAAFNNLTTKGITYTNEFLSSFMVLSLFKPVDDVVKNYMAAYDKKAIEAWNKLALGSSLIITSKDKKERERLEASLINTIDLPKHGNFNSENTVIYNFADTAEPEAIIEQVKNVSEVYPDKKLIFTMDFDSVIAKMLEEKEGGTYEFKPEIFEFLSLAKDDVRFVLYQNDNSYYQFISSPAIKKACSNFINYSIPPIRSFEVEEILKEEKLLKKEIKKTFTKDAREKAIILAEKMEGTFPDKAINLMQRISNYFGDDINKITSKEVEEFAHVATELFNNQTEESSIVYNTGKTLATYYGKETTKKDIENLVKQIKTGRVGTQGIIIYSKDDEAGSGKKYTAKVIAGEAKVPFMEINTSDFALSAVADEYDNKIPPASLMKKLFTDLKLAAKQNQYKTAIMYINGFEEFAFSNSYFSGYEQALAQLTKEMEKAMNEDVNILVMGGTQEYYAGYIPMFIKDFSNNIVVDSPAYNKKSRKEIISNLLNKNQLPLAYKTKEQKEDLINKIVKVTEYFSYVDIKNLINKTSQVMIERNKTKAGIGEFVEAYLQLEAGRTSRPEMPDFNREATTSHECGHATNLEVMNNLYNKKGQPWHKSRDVNFITLDPRGSFLGAVFEGKVENTDYPFEALFSDLVCSYGGHSCEKEFFNMDGSSGISQDLAQATNLAKYGVEYYGLGYNTGKMSNAARINSAIYSEKVYKDLEVMLTNAQIVSDLITEVYKDFNKEFTQKYSKLIGTDNCMIDGDEFRKQLNTWIASRSKAEKEELSILEDIILDVIKYTKNGKIYHQTKKIIK